MSTAVLIIKNCLIGKNLNLTVVRGFARMGSLADISRPDVYDQQLNPFGTQRDLNAKHSEDAMSYAMEALTLPSERSPRAFTEVILNARDSNVLTITSSLTGEIIDDLISTSGNQYEGLTVDLSINLDGLNQNSTIYPQISRVDGNHRLSQAEEISSEEGELPTIPFALFVGLSADQERAIFRDINGTSVKVETAYLDTIRLFLENDELLKNSQGRALKIAEILKSEDGAFEGKINMGGSKKGVKAVTGAVPPLTINALKSAVASSIGKMSDVEVQIFGSGVNEDGETVPPSLQQIRTMAVLLDRYWKAVSAAYPQAWQNKRDYVLLQSIGFTALSWLGGDIISRLLQLGTIEQSHFNPVLAGIASEVSLDKNNFQGLAGLAGARIVYMRLLEAFTNNEAPTTIALSQINNLVQDAGPLE